VDRLPTTWEQLLTDARKVSAVNKSDRFGNAAYYCYPPVTFEGNYGIAMRVLPWFNQNGAALSDDEGNPMVNSAQAVETWLWHNDLMSTSQDMYSASGKEWLDENPQFNEGNIAYLMGWSGNWTTIGEMGTNAVAVELPLPPGGKPGNITIGNSFYAACEGGKHPDLGQALVTEIYIQEENQAWIPQNIGVWIPALKSLLEQWESYDRLDAFKTETAKQMARVTMKVLLSGNARSLAPWAKNVDPIWAEWNKSYQRIWEGKLDRVKIQAELDQLQIKIEELLA
jgi:hypothetical protein